MESAAELLPVRVGVAPDSKQRSGTRWGALHRITFRIGCAYLVVYALHGIVLATDSGFIADPLVGRYTAGWQAIATWVGFRIFHLTAQQTGTLAVGDGMAQWIQNLCQLVMAVSAAVIWSVLDRGRLHYRGLHVWLRLLIRYVLAYVVFSYGFGKLFPLQFKPTQFSELATPYGEFPRMAVLWTFMQWLKGKF